MRTRFAIGTLALCAALAAAPGCSFVLVQGPPRGHEQMTSFSCTRGNAVPLVDAAVAGTGLFVGGTLMAAGHANEWVAAYGVVGAGLVVEGLVFGVSSLVGFHRTAHCREALRAARAR